jgi:hypothetical protein
MAKVESYLMWMMKIFCCVFLYAVDIGERASQWLAEQTGSIVRKNI